MKKFVIILSLIFICSSVGWAVSAFDPTETSFASKNLGLGGIRTVFAADANSLFTNPAGISGIKSFQLNSTASKKIGEIDYFVFGGVTPFDPDAFGIGYISLNSGTGGVGDLNEDTNTVEATGDTISEYYNVLLVNYSRALTETLKGGVALKFYSRAIPDVTGESTAQGMEADLGFIYSPLPRLSVGLVQRNFLPSSAGGKLTWSDNTEEGFATNTVCGLAFQLSKTLLLLGEVDFKASRTVKILSDVGLQAEIHPGIVLRAGIDQDATETSALASSDVTFGLGVQAVGFGFDYAYHPYGSVPSNATNYFTLSYLGPAEGAAKKTLITKRELIAPLTNFDDIPSDYWARQQIEQLATAGVISGYPDNTFRPEGEITRAELCTLLMKSQGESAVESSLNFNDLAKNHWAAPYIAQAVGEEVVTGYPDNTFKPQGSVNRAEGITIFARFDKLPETRVSVPFYRDLPGRHWAFKYVEAAREAGMLDYIQWKVFVPQQRLTRAEAAYILAKTKVGQQRVDSLYRTVTVEE
ncbi:MAG: S-layer homology domain-containing protein [bacterium]